MRIEMKIWLGILIAVFMLVQTPAADEYTLLTVKASVSPSRLSRSQAGKVTLRFSVEKEIKINSQPSFTIELDPSDELTFPKDFFSSSDLAIEIFEEDGKEFLNLSEPVAIPFTVKLEAKRGSHMLSGSIKFFASSITEGWCLKDKIRFSASFYTSNRIAKKPAQLTELNDRPTDQLTH